MEELPGLWKAMESDISKRGKLTGKLFSLFFPKCAGSGCQGSEFADESVKQRSGSSGSPTVSAVAICQNIPTIIVGVIMCLLSSYFFVAQREEVIAAFRRYVPESFRKKWDVMYHSLTGAIGGYFKAQLKIEIWVYLLMLVGFLILRVRYGALISIGIAILDFFAVFGTGTVLWPWAVIEGAWRRL